MQNCRLATRAFWNNVLDLKSNTETFIYFLIFGKSSVEYYNFLHYPKTSNYRFPHCVKKGTEFIIYILCM